VYKVKPDITRLYTDEEIVQAAIEVLRRKMAHVDGMIAGINTANHGSQAALQKESELLKTYDLLQDGLNKAEEARAIAMDESTPQVGP
jgi:hypothetical protein